jgi:hypothetical protein
MDAHHGCAGGARGTQVGLTDSDRVNRVQPRLPLICLLNPWVNAVTLPTR